ncbi:MAG: twin-arginine translocation signal domain-containing protein [Acidobacteria bacterium]|nr:twin-arginine translocation signal domain-containing protein [Acidobacteriota bacterium]
MKNRRSFLKTSTLAGAGMLLSAGRKCSSTLGERPQILTPSVKTRTLTLVEMLEAGTHCHMLEHEDNDMMRPYKVTR